jgi:chemotaxis signal transduction protein
MELLLFRLGDRGYASPRERVREVVDVGAGQPAIPGLAASSLGGLGGGQRPVALVSLRVALGLPDRGAEGRILVVATRPARSASWSTRWCGCCATTRPCAGPGRPAPAGT